MQSAGHGFIENTSTLLEHSPSLVRMNWTDGPATWKQLRHLSNLGYKPDHHLTKSEASDLICRLEGKERKPQKAATLVEAGVTATASSGAYQFRVNAEKARDTLAQDEHGQPQDSQHRLGSAIAKRQEFWLDTCCDVAQMHVGSKQVLDLYRKYGCLFHTPTHCQVQEVLDALDSAMPLWDRDHPHLFYETLGLNFPELLRRR